MDCVSRCGLDVADAQAGQRVDALRERRLAGAGVGVGGEAVGAAVADELLGEAPRPRGPWWPSRLETLTCSRAPCSTWAPDAVELGGGALGVGEQQAVAEAGEARDGGVEDVVEALERALEQQPGRVRRGPGRSAASSSGSSVSASSWASSPPRWSVTFRPSASIARCSVARRRARPLEVERVVRALDVRRASATSRTSSASRRRAKLRLSSRVREPSSRPGRMWQWRSTYGMPHSGNSVARAAL